MIVDASGVTWGELEAAAPEVAAAGRRLLEDAPGVPGAAFLGTVGADGTPRIHPFIPAVAGGALWAFVVDGPKQRDLQRNGHYALHSETCPPPREDDGFYVTGTATLVEDPAVKERLGAQLKRERKLESLWPNWPDDLVFELRIERVVRDPAWILVQAQSMRDELLSYGAIERLEDLR